MIQAVNPNRLCKSARLYPPLTCKCLIPLHYQCFAGMPAFAIRIASNGKESGYLFTFSSMLRTSFGSRRLFSKVTSHTYSCPLQINHVDRIIPLYNKHHRFSRPQLDCGKHCVCFSLGNGLYAGDFFGGHKFFETAFYFFLIR